MVNLEFGMREVVSGSSQTVTIARAAVEAIIAHARDAVPAECCGLLLGRDGEVLEAVRALNVADDQLSRFVIDPKNHIDHRREARRRGLDVAGFYHSHPRSAARPSATDCAEASYPDHLYLIVSLAQEPPDVGLYRLDGVNPGNFLQLPFVTVG
jgi:proteasome lid subunit RPN8/RPN11